MKRSPIPYAPSVFAYWKCSDTVGDKDLHVEKKLVIDDFHPDVKLNLERCLWLGTVVAEDTAD